LDLFERAPMGGCPSKALVGYHPGRLGERVAEDPGRQGRHSHRSAPGTDRGIKGGVHRHPQEALVVLAWTEARPSDVDDDSGRQFPGPGDRSHPGPEGAVLHHPSVGLVLDLPSSRPDYGGGQAAAVGEALVGGVDDGV
jgi:hypothetical protein